MTPCPAWDVGALCTSLPWWPPRPARGIPPTPGNTVKSLMQAGALAFVCGTAAGFVAITLGAREWSVIVAFVAACAAAWVASDDGR